MSIPTTNWRVAVPLLVLLMAACVGLTFCEAPAAEVEGLYVEAGAAFPHNEPDILPGSGSVARYVFTLGADLAVAERFAVRGRARVYGEQPWRVPEEVGAGVAAWGGSDWRIHSATTVYEWESEARVTRRLSLMTEHLWSPSDDVPYYHLVKARWRFR